MNITRKFTFCDYNIYMGVLKSKSEPFVESIQCKKKKKNKSGQYYKKGIIIDMIKIVIFFISKNCLKIYRSIILHGRGE